MRFSLAAVAALLSAAHARIVGIAVPDHIKPGQPGFNAVIISTNYIQSVYDVAIAFGASPGSGFPDALGQVAGSYYLGPEQSNQISNFTKWVVLPSNLPLGEGVVGASLFSLYGASSSPVLSNYQVPVTFSNYTSTKYVSSLQS